MAWEPSCSAATMQFCLMSLLMLLALNSSNAATWNTKPENGSTLNKCSGSDVSLPWSYSLSPGEAVVNITWLFNDRLMAQNTSSNFLTQPEFKDRLQLVTDEHLSGPQLIIKSVTVKDTGHYKINIKGSGKNGSEFTLEKTLTLDVIGYENTVKKNRFPNVMYKCKGSDVPFPWDPRPNEGDTIEIHRFYHKDDVMAVKVRHLLIPVNKYMGRIKFDGTGLDVFVLMNVTEKDSGPYFEILKGSSVCGNRFTLNNTLTLEVTDGLMTTDSLLHAFRTPSLVWDKPHDRWTTELVCGNFTYLTNSQPFDVKWISPSGNSLHSTGYKHGVYFLLLASSLENGAYTCLVSKETPNTCVSADVKASVTIDAISAQFTMLHREMADQKSDFEAHKKSILERIQDLEDNGKNMTQKLDEAIKKFSNRDSN